MEMRKQLLQCELNSFGMLGRNATVLCLYKILCKNREIINQMEEENIKIGLKANKSEGTVKVSWCGKAASVSLPVIIIFV